MLLTELGRAGLLAVAYLLILAGAEAWYRLAKPHVELSRKLVHLASGLPVLAFPWIFESPWSVALLSGFVAGVLAAAGRAGTLTSVLGVERRSMGELLYPVGVVLLFFLAHDEPVHYFTAALVLILADPAAALVGLWYGQRRYAVEDHWRSAEGSTVFFLTTFLAVHLPLLLMARVSPGLAVLVALVVALVVTLLEAVALYGSDNLTVPLSTFILLDHLTAGPIEMVAGHVAAILGILAFVWALASRTRLLRASGVFATTLFFYAIFFLAGPWWVVPVFLSALALAWVRSRLDPSGPIPDAEYQVVAIGYAACPTLVISMGFYLAPDASFPALPTDPTAFASVFAGAVAGHLGIMCALQFHPFGPDWDRRLPAGRLLLCVMGSLVLVGPATLWMTRAFSLGSFVISLCVGLASAAAYWVVRSATRWPSANPWNYRLQTLSLTAVIVVTLSLLARTGG